MDLSKALTLAGFVAAPLLAVVMLWLSGVAVAHVKTAEKCGRWLIAVALFAATGIGFIAATCSVFYVGYSNYGWLNAPGWFNMPWIVTLAVVVLIVWASVYEAGRHTFKMRKAPPVPAANHQPPVRGYDTPKVAEAQA